MPSCWNLPRRFTVIQPTGQNPSFLPNWHNVNIAQCFREPPLIICRPEIPLCSKASYNVHHLIRRTFGQVPGGMFGADENAVWDISIPSGSGNLRTGGADGF